ncbi:hypothetical protein FPRO05_08562 [Fusarium proliferatum]|uniref:Uncharacterized protein n=1 Tax=Gibberella intermedia TaxID=948311 RepID=A0A365NH17_GIBIN|nr:hypothetical protein FPRO05_08562 [Fusarium proliferatum]
MTSKTNAECLLNTTECLLQTVASILTEIQQQNSEYNWDPLTFTFTAIIGIIAIAFAALTAFQAFLTAGPGRTKSGAYAIGPWSQRNYRKFDLAEMRFRTTSSTPIFTAESLDFKLLKGPTEDFISSHEKPGGLRKGQEDYFPATWLAFLTHLSLDYTKAWKHVKLTGADFIPSEFSAVPAYGSIRFVTTLAMVLSRGLGRLTIDRESGLPRVRDTSFNLIFRQHPLLGAIGFFEKYGKMGSKYSCEHSEIHRRLLETHGQMNIPKFNHMDHLDGRLIEMGNLLTFSDFYGEKISRLFMKSVQRTCPHHNDEPKSACLNLSDYLEGFHPDFFTKGPLYLLMAYIPNPAFLPILFPYKKAKLRERLDTLLLQSRFWGLKSLASCDIFPNLSANHANSMLDMTKAANSWVRSTINPNMKELSLGEKACQHSSVYLNKSSTIDREYNEESREVQELLSKEVEIIDSWLSQIQSQVPCRKLTLSVIGDGIRQVIDAVHQQRISEVVSPAKDATKLPSRCILANKLGCFLEAIEEPGILNCLYTVGCESSVKSPGAIRRDTSEGLKKIRDMWQTEESSVEDIVNSTDHDADGGQEYKSYAWKLPDVINHPLDDVLIYRAVLITLVYSLSNDTSALMDEDLGLIVPIM